MKRQGLAKRWPAMLLLLPLAMVLILFAVAPALWVVLSSVQVDGHWSLENFNAIIGTFFYRQAFGNSIMIALTSSLFGLLIALVAATSLRRVSCRLRAFVIAYTSMASNLSGVPLAFAFIIILGANGAATLLLRQSGLLGDFNLYSRSGLVLVYTYFQIPFALLMLYPALDALQDDWAAAAALLGASRRRYWQYIGLPILLPAVSGTFILLFANALGAYATAYALMTSNYNLVTIRVASLVAGDIFPEPNLAAALAVLLIGLMMLTLCINQWLLRRHVHAR